MISRCQFTVDSSQLVWCVDGVNRIVCDVCLCACRWLCGRVNESEMLAWWTMWNLPAFTWNRGSHQNNNNSRVLRTLHVDEDHLAQLQSMSMRSDVHKNNIGPSVLIPLLCFVTKLWSSQDSFSNGSSDKRERNWGVGLTSSVVNCPDSHDFQMSVHCWLQSACVMCRWCE